MTQPTAQPRAPAGSLWRHADFRRLWVGETISQAGSQLTGLALPVLAVTVLRATPPQMGYLTAAETAAFLVVGLPAGALVDRWRTRRVLIAGDLVRAVALAGIPLAWAAGALTLTQLYLTALVVGVATVFFDVAYQSYLPELVAGSQLVDGNAKLQASESVAQVAGPAVGGQLLRLVAPPVLVAVDAVTFLASAAFVGRIRQRTPAPDRTTRRALRVEIAEGLAFVVRHPLLSRIAACTSVSNLFGSMNGALFAYFVLTTLGLDVGTLGLIFTVSSVGGLVGAVAAARLARGVGEGRLIPVSALVSACFVALQPVAGGVTGPGLRVGLLMVSGFGFVVAVVVYNITQVSFRQRLCPPALLGRMNASVRFLVWGVMPIGALAGGWLGGSIGIVPTLWISAVGQLLAALPVLLSPLLRMRDLPSAPGDDEGPAPS